MVRAQELKEVVEAAATATSECILLLCHFRMRGKQSRASHESLAGNGTMSQPTKCYPKEVTFSNRNSNFIITGIWGSAL